MRPPGQISNAGLCNLYVSAWTMGKVIALSPALKDLMKRSYCAFDDSLARAGSCGAVLLSL